MSVDNFSVRWTGQIVPPVSGSLEVEGLSAPVRIIRDRWGVPHIVASTMDDLFFAQGFVQAEDRLFQMDLWRRSGQGRLAEVLGANFVGRDAMTRRLQYRGNLDEEWASYGPDTRAIASAFVRGINAWVIIARERPSEEFLLAAHPSRPQVPSDGGRRQADCRRGGMAAPLTISRRPSHTSKTSRGNHMASVIGPPRIPTSCKGRTTTARIDASTPNHANAAGTIRPRRRR